MSSDLQKKVIGALVALALAAAVSYGLITQQTADKVQSQADQTLNGGSPQQPSPQPQPQAPAPQNPNAGTQPPVGTPTQSPGAGLQPPAGTAPQNPAPAARP